MTTYKVGYNSSTKEARILASATAIPNGFVSAGTFVHDDDPNDGLHYHGNHSVFHHVRGLLYRALGLLNMQIINIKYDAGLTPIAPPS